MAPDEKRDAFWAIINLSHMSMAFTRHPISDCSSRHQGDSSLYFQHTLSLSKIKLSNQRWNDRFSWTNQEPWWPSWPYEMAFLMTVQALASCCTYLTSCQSLKGCRIGHLKMMVKTTLRTWTRPSVCFSCSFWNGAANDNACTQRPSASFDSQNPGERSPRMSRTSHGRGTSCMELLAEKMQGQTAAPNWRPIGHLTEDLHQGRQKMEG